jgi:hypothetical protein
MNKRWILLICIIVAALVALWVFRRTTNLTVAPVTTNSPFSAALSSSPKSDSPNTNESMTNVNGLLLSRPRLFKTTNYPPQTAEEKAQWDWWRAMRETDPSFEGKTPIEFYGKVIDQFSNGVEGANVVLAWTTVVGPTPTPEKRMMSGRNGLFSISDIRGKRLAVDVSKEGYLSTSNSSQSFEYSDFTDQLFHVPDANNPVIFRLQKLMGAEPLYKFLPYGEIPVNGAPLILNVEKGKIGAQGDLACSVTLGNGRGDFGAADFTVTLDGLNGTVFSQSDEEFLFNAPESGYQKTITIAVKADDPNYQWTQKLRFYVKTSNSKFAAAEVKVTLYGNLKSAGFSAIIYYNPSGSRNLEFDQDKVINRWQN